MTLLFFLRSPAGNTDTGQDPAPASPGIYWDDDPLPKRKKREKSLDKEIKKEEQKAKEKWRPILEEIEAEDRKRKKKRRSEEFILLLLKGLDDDD